MLSVFINCTYILYKRFINHFSTINVLFCLYNITAKCRKDHILFPFEVSYDSISGLSNANCKLPMLSLEKIYFH